jgi:transcriptional antiterminator RfaH
MRNDSPVWYILRTKRHKELFVKQQASLFVEDVYLPFLRIKRRYLDKTFYKTEALFPGYVFAFFSLSQSFYTLKSTLGVVGIVCAGSEPCEVNVSVIEEIKRREKDGLVVLNEPTLRWRERVSITQGPLRGLEGVFERYLQGPERVAVLLHNIGNLRVVLPCRSLATVEGRRVA